MTHYAETQTTINGPYEPTNWTLSRCWMTDLGNMTDYNLLRDNAQDAEIQLLEQMKQFGEYLATCCDNIHISGAFEDLTSAIEDYLINEIWTRVEHQGFYRRDGKITREEGF